MPADASTEGVGVNKDSKEAAKWYRLAAVRGDAAAQYNLSLAYLKGDGVNQDYVRAYMWSNIAAANGNADAAKVIDYSSTAITTQQLEEARNMARKCVESTYEQCD